MFLQRENCKWDKQILIYEITLEESLLFEVVLEKVI